MADSTCEHQYILKRVRNILGVGSYSGRPIRMAKYECRCGEWLTRIFYDENEEVSREWKWKIYSCMDERKQPIFAT